MEKLIKLFNEASSGLSKEQRAKAILCSLSSGILFVVSFILGLIAGIGAEIGIQWLSILGLSFAIVFGAIGLVLLIYLLCEIL